jgi:hypothetical protein
VALPGFEGLAEATRLRLGVRIQEETQWGSFPNGKNDFKVQESCKSVRYPLGITGKMEHLLETLSGGRNMLGNVPMTSLKKMDEVFKPI